MLNYAAAYIRVSSDRQEEYSPASQIKLTRERAEKDGYIIPDEYVYFDDGISGKSAKKRNDFNRMIAMAKEKDRPFDVIYVWKFSRFARNQEESLVYKNLLKKFGVSVTSVSEVIPEGQFGSLIERIIEWMDEFYLVNLGSEVSRGLEEKFSRGEPATTPPFGYDMIDKGYVPNADAEIVKEIFARYAGGEKQRAIALDLAARGVRTRPGNPPDNRWVSYILNNPVYIGLIRRSVDGARDISRRRFTAESVVTVQGKHDPIITEDLWERAQAALERQAKMYPKYSRQKQTVQYLLKGLIRCGTCGSTLVVGGYSGKAKVPYLHCHSYGRGHCPDANGITAARLDKEFIAALKAAVGNKEFTIVPPPPPPQVDGVDYAKLIAAENRRIDRAREAYLSGVDTLDQYKAAKAEIDKRIASLEERLGQAAAQPVDFNAYAEKVMGVVSFIEQDNVPTEAKNEALRAIISKVVYNKSADSLSIFFHNS